MLDAVLASSREYLELGPEAIDEIKLTFRRERPAAGPRLTRDSLLSDLCNTDPPAAPVIEGMHDSGSRQSFETGAVRDASGGKPIMSLVTPFAIRRLGRWYTLGAQKYAPRNWEKGMPLTRYLDSLERHVLAFKEGDDTEDHLAAIMWNAAAIIHTKEMIERGRLPRELDDMPDYSPVTAGSR
jgi:hypothetical protein